MKDIFIDAHCHYFNAGYVLLETLSWLGEFFTKSRKSVHARGAMTQESMDRGQLWLVDYLVELLDAAGSSVKGNYKREVTQYKKPNPAKRQPNFWAVPLMMDIYYFCTTESSIRSQKPVPRPAIRKSLKELLDDHGERLGEMIQQSIARTAARDGKSKHWSKAMLRKTNALFDQLKSRAESDDYSTDWPDVEMSLGYQDHLNALRLLAHGVNTSGSGDKVFPFLAIDPRRSGVVKLLTDYGLVSNTGPFYGVKLYPALGYLPTHPELLPVYKFCAKNYIPITVHCSHAGLITPLRTFNVWSQDPSPGSLPTCTAHTFADEADTARFFSCPNHWTSILRQYDKLKVNFAHLGGPDAGATQEENDYGWTESILDLIEKFTGVYTDASCFSSGDVDTLKKILGKKGQAADRVMFGTDYIIFLLYHTYGGLSNYFNVFDAASGHLPTQMFCENAVNFLGVT